MSSRKRKEREKPIGPIATTSRSKILSEWWLCGACNKLDYEGDTVPYEEELFSCHCGKLECHPGCLPGAVLTKRGRFLPAKEIEYYCMGFFKKLFCFL